MADIVVFGATGFTGRLVTQYLNTHPQRATFTLGVHARSKQKLVALREELQLDDGVEAFYADVLNREEVVAVVKQAKVVINTVGPFWRWGDLVVGACAEYGRHYVDLSGEPHWIRKVILELDYLSSKTHSIIIPSSGMDSIPSDIAVYLSNKTLKTLVSPDARIDNSVSAFHMSGAFSGGTIATALSTFTEVPKKDLILANLDYALSTGIKGVPSPPSKLVYTLPYSSPPTFGGVFIMRGANRATVQRTWGLNQIRATNPDTASEAKLRAYGPEFKYDEFMATPGRVSALLMSLGVAFAAVCMMFPPFRWLFAKLMPKPGEGPTEKQQREGWLQVVNMTSSTSPRALVRTFVRGKGDPGYSLTAVMISESALALLHAHADLPEWIRGGGVFTPASALGDVLVRRLEESGRMSFTSEVLEGRAE